MEHVGDAVISDGAFHIFVLCDVAWKKLESSHLLRCEERSQARGFRVDVKNKRLLAAIHQFLDDPRADESFCASDEKSLAGWRLQAVLLGYASCSGIICVREVSQ